MTVILSIDPGDPHCGYATFVNGECTQAEEHVPYRMLSLLELRCWRQDVEDVVLEGWVAMPGQHAAKTADMVATCKVIGVVEWLTRKYGVPLHVQQPNVKKPTAAILKAHGVLLKSAGAGGHAKDAELHGHAYLLRKKEGQDA